MKWASFVSERTPLKEAIAECATSLKGDFGDAQPDLAIVFVSPHHAAEYSSVADQVADVLQPKLLVGCSANGVIGGGREVENRPGFSLTVAQLPEVELFPFHLESQNLPSPDAGPEAWEEVLKVRAEPTPQFVLLADPFSFTTEDLLLGLDYAFGRSAKIGGLASAADGPGGNVLYLGREVYGSGAVGVALSGNILLDTIVAQGCRPIGVPMRVTNCRRNILFEVDGQSPLRVLRDLFEAMSERDRELLRHSLFLGVGMDELREDYNHGDFLMRNILGIDGESHALAVGALLREGQVVQFHLRDAVTSAEDLEMLLARYSSYREGVAMGGALLFSCLGRGMYLYGHADHDTQIFKDKVGVLPLGGFFCNGEIGPVGDATYLHGYTSSFGVFRPVTPRTD